jgi:predicted RNA binding protein YcfA (HicA-like mRNA interferase family)
VTLVHSADSTRIAVVPVHKGTTIRPGTLRAILRGAQLTIDELNALL